MNRYCTVTITSSNYVRTLRLMCCYIVRESLTGTKYHVSGMVSGASCSSISGVRMCESKDYRAWYIYTDCICTVVIIYTSDFVIGSLCHIECKHSILVKERRVILTLVLVKIRSSGEHSQHSICI